MPPARQIERHAIQMDNGLRKRRRVFTHGRINGMCESGAPCRCAFGSNQRFEYLPVTKPCALHGGCGEIEQEKRLQQTPKRFQHHFRFRWLVSRTDDTCHEPKEGLAIQRFWRVAPDFVRDIAENRRRNCGTHLNRLTQQQPKAVGGAEVPLQHRLGL
jgi:hypothetical protein